MGALFPPEVSIVADSRRRRVAAAPIHFRAAVGMTYRTLPRKTAGAPRIDSCGEVDWNHRRQKLVMSSRMPGITI